MDDRKEVVFSDLGALCAPQFNISPVRELYKWNAVPYETAEVKGTMLVSLQEGRPGNVTLDPGLTGWYRVFVGQYHDSQSVNVKLSGDGAFTNFASGGEAGYARHAVEDVYWKSADMTGEQVVIGKYRAGSPADAAIAWLRFVPMDAGEAAAFRADQAREDRKRIYATHDMHGMLSIAAPQDQDDWRTIVQAYEQSDVKWFSMENILIFDGGVSTGNPDNFAYPRPGDEMVQKGLKPKYTCPMIADLCGFGHRMGLKMCVSMRMGAWGIEFPYDQMYFTNTFMEEHRELRCVDRDGTPIDALSYVYPEVRSYIIGQFVRMAATGCDAVEMIYTRGVPYVLFEAPFVERFEKKYGQDPRYLPLDDERVTAERCAVMTEFVRELRAALDAAGRKNVGLHARTQFSLYDCRHVGEDLETWAKEGLIDTVISYPQRIREVLRGDVWRDGDPEHLDPDKYERYMRGAPESIIYRRQDFQFMPPMEDSRGVLRGPKDQAERVAEFMALERYGVTVYLEIMPRYMPAEEYRKRALELYGCGCGHISLWDTYGRVPNKVQWSMIRRLGHKDELSCWSDGRGEYYSYHRLLRIGDKDVSRYVPAWGG